MEEEEGSQVEEGGEGDRRQGKVRTNHDFVFLVAIKEQGSLILTFSLEAEKEGR